MPQLPSGRHVAIQATPLNEMIKHASDPGIVHKIMAIDSMDKVLQYFEILYLVPRVNDDEGEV